MFLFLLFLLKKHVSAEKQKQKQKISKGPIVSVNDDDGEHLVVR